MKLHLPLAAVLVAETAGLAVAQSEDARLNAFLVTRFGPEPGWDP